VAASRTIESEEDGSRAQIGARRPGRLILRLRARRRARASVSPRQSVARSAPLAAERSEAALDSHVGTGSSDLVFTSPAGETLHHGNFRKRVWLPALETVGLTNVHVHDLRHAGNVLVADVGANLRELMERMGHITTRAALIYLHGGDDRPRALAAGVSDQVRAALQSEGKTRPLGSGTDLARAAGARRPGTRST
jgi:integrase